MLGDTITITVNSVAQVLNKINQDNFSATYLKVAATEEFQLVIRHSQDKVKADGVRRDRHNIRLIHTIYGVAGASDAVREISQTFVNPRADDKAGFAKVNAGLVNYTTEAVVGRILGWES